MTTLFARGPSEGQGWPQKRRLFAFDRIFYQEAGRGKDF
jgi:hypothetical protein